MDERQPLVGHSHTGGGSTRPRRAPDAAPPSPRPTPSAPPSRFYNHPVSPTIKTPRRFAVEGFSFFHADGKSVASTGADGTLRLWDVAEGKERWRQTAHKGEGLAVAFGPREALASCGSDGVIAVYTMGGRAVATSAAVGDWLNALGFGTDDDTVFVGDAQGRVHRLGVKAKKVTASVPLRPAQ